MNLGVRIGTMGMIGLALSTGSALGASHLWQIHEIFTTADGSVQFIEMRECCGAQSENFLLDKWIRSETMGSQFTFPENIPGNTANRHLLLATEAFEALPGAPTPDYIIPANFFSIDADTLTYWFYAAATMTYKSGDLPTDGVMSLDRFGAVAANSPTNYAGATGSVDASCAAPAILDGAQGVSFDDRAFDGFVDARAESSNGKDVDLGLSAVTLVFTTSLENTDGTPLSADAFSIVDTGGAAPSISGISTEDGQTVTLNLSEHLTVAHRTTIGVNARAQCDAAATIDETITIGYLPADVDQNGCVTPFDLLTFRQYVNGAQPSMGVREDYVDTNRDGPITPFDLLAFRQLVNGAGSATQSWSGVCLP